jgi:hypothetical protein
MAWVNTELWFQVVLGASNFVNADTDYAAPTEPGNLFWLVFLQIRQSYGLCGNNCGNIEHRTRNAEHRMREQPKGWTPNAALRRSVFDVSG